MVCRGVGLAAPQVGISRRMAVIFIPRLAAALNRQSSVPVYPIINPQYSPLDSAVTGEYYQQRMQALTTTFEVRQARKWLQLRV